MTGLQSSGDGVWMGEKGIRRSHRKSRGGCTFCKGRRIKCDERRPHCTNCARRLLACSLNESPPPAPTTENAAQPDLSEPLSSDLQPINQCDENGLTLDLQDLQLFHHFCSFTSTTFSPTAGFQQFWSITAVQMAFSYPFLLRALLAVGGLHLDHLRKNNDTSNWYKSKATAHWNAAVRLATPWLAEINESSCDPLFIFAVLSCVQAFAKGPQPGNYLLFTKDTEKERPIFLSGLRSVAQASVHFGLTEPGKPLAFMYGITKVDLERLHRDEPVTFWGSALRNLCQIMVSQVADEEERRVYDEALRRLTAAFAAVFGNFDSIRGANSQAVFAWLYHVSEGFVERLQAKENLALVFFAHFVVLIKQIEGVWTMKGWPDHLISGIYHALPPVSRLWIRWPMERIGWCPTI